MRYTKAERELAADLCAMAASNPGRSTWDCASFVAARGNGRVLANQAWWSAWRSGMNVSSPAERYAEAEARLRTGWLP